LIINHIELKNKMPVTTALTPKNTISFPLLSCGGRRLA
jgi:hypothetical protein